MITKNSTSDATLQTSNIPEPHKAKYNRIRREEVKCHNCQNKIFKELSSEPQQHIKGAMEKGHLPGYQPC